MFIKEVVPEDGFKISQKIFPNIWIIYVRDIKWAYVKRVSFQPVTRNYVLFNTNNYNPVFLL